MKGIGFREALKGAGVSGFGEERASPSPASQDKIALAMIEPDPDQPRKIFDEAKLQELADSMKEHGLQQPVGLRAHPTKPGHYMLRFGERRFRAAQLLGWTEIHAIVSDSGNVPMQALIENLQRDDLTPLEIGDALLRAMDTLKLKASALAKALGKSPAWVSLYTSVAQLPESFQQHLKAGTVSDADTLLNAARLADRHPDPVAKLLDSAGPDNPVTRDSVRNLKAALESAKGPAGARGENTSAGNGKPAQHPASKPGNLPLVFVSDGSEIGYLNLTKRAPDGKVFLVRGEGLETLEPLADLKLIRIEQPA